MKYLGIFFVVLALISATPVFAQPSNDDVTTSFERPKNIKERIQLQKEQYKQSLDRVHKLREDLNNATTSEEKKEIQKSARQSFIRRIEVAIERLDTMYDRIEARVNQVDDLGYDVSEPKSFLREADDKINNVKDDFKKIQTRIAEFDKENDSQDFVSLKTEIRALFPEIKENIKGAHGDLINALQSLREVIQEIKEDKENEEVIVEITERPGDEPVETEVEIENNN